MKKFLAALLAVITVFTVFALSACGGDKYASLKIGSISGFGQNLINKSSFDYKLDIIDDDDFEYAATHQLKIDTALINYIDGKPEMFRAMATPAEEVLIIGAKDAEAAKQIANGPITDWVKHLHDGYSDYGPEQLPKIDSCVKTVAGRYVFLIISKDNTAAKAALNELLDTALKIHD
ncbi:MAG: DUF4358 domain-containing protein [Clostridia bacterium]|nr:DUF4358 domain-containing protein [Clostridia bacterium]